MQEILQVKLHTSTTMGQTLYLDGKAEVWYKGFLYVGENLAS
jgi:hypothetical protein